MIRASRIILLPIILGLLFISSNAEARKYRVHRGESHTQQRFFPTEDIMRPFSPTFGTFGPNTRQEQRRFLKSRGTSTSGVVSHLASKVAEIQSACGSNVISAVSHRNIAGTRRLSLHASGKAVDMSGNPGCIYAHLHSWAGGYSVDYGRVQHVHISYDPQGGREMGLRFNHGGYRHHRRHGHA